MRILVLLGLAACYDPHAVVGAPCSEVDPCPTGQACVEGSCGGAIMADAGGDGSDGIAAGPDRDGDQIGDATDNCPDVANGDQSNEDSDRFGDVCDPCPVETNDTPSDPDGDGVADSCDPRPTAAGDRIVVFEGFQRAIPTSWQVIGDAVRIGGEVVLTSVAGNHTAIVPPVASIANGTITARLVVDATVGSFDAAVTVAMPYDPSSDLGISCELYAPNAGSTSGRYVTLYDGPSDVERAKRAFAWATATPYRVALTRSGGNYVCSVTPAGATAQTASGSTGSNPPASKPAIVVYSANAHAAWLLVVSSP